jgi:hypothetical protein
MRQTRDWNMRGQPVLLYLEIGDPVIVFPLVEHIVVVGTLLLTKALRSPAHAQEFVTNVTNYNSLLSSRNNI